MFLKNILLFTLFIVMAFTSLGGQEVYSERLEGNSITSGAVLETYDGEFFTMMSYPSTWPNIFVNENVQNRIRLGLNPEVAHVADANMSVTLNITGTKADGSVVSTTKTLSVNYLIDGYQVINDLSTVVLEDFHKVRVEVASMSAVNADYFYLQSEIDVERYYLFSTNSTLTSGVNIDNTNGEYLDVHWKYMQGAEEYELEYVHINDYTEVENIFLASNQLDYNFYLNSTRVRLSELHHRIPNTFEHGYFVYRVRAIGRNIANPSQKVFGKWNVVESGLVSDVPTPNVLHITSEFESDKNWGYQVIISEDGRRLEDIYFSDGLGRTRQSITHNTETDQTLISSNYYDSHGRPTIKTLPVPENSEDLGYRNNYNYYQEIDNGVVVNELPLTGKEYDFINDDPNGCAPTLIPLSKNYGAGKYYSDQNTDQDEEKGSIPDANGFPYSRVEYMPDGTGRIKRVGGMGEEFQVGQGNEVLFFYTTPTQEELVRLFGSEVGKQNQYQKRLMRDGNGQLYVEYYDLAGRVIANGMLGDAPSNLESLDNNIQEVGFARTIIPEDLYDLNTVPNVVVYSKPEVIPDDGDYTFDFYLTPEQYQSECMAPSICFDCVYEVRLSIAEAECTGEIFYDQTYMVNGTQLDAICNGVSQFNDQVVIPLNAGTYQVERSIAIAPDAIDDYWCLYLENTTCVSDYPTIFEGFYQNLQVDACEIPAFVLSENNGPQDCNILLEMLVNDMIPGGQFALYDVDANGNYSASAYPLSVLNVSNQLGGNWKSPASPYMDNATDAAQVFVELLPDGVTYSPAVTNPALVTVGTNPGEFYTVPENLANVEDFIVRFKPYWGLSLKDFHPESCYHDFCVASGDYHQYTYDIDQVNEHSEACATGYYNPLNLPTWGPNSIYPTVNNFFSSCTNAEVDEFFTTGSGSEYFLDMRSDMGSYVTLYDASNVAYSINIWLYSVVEATGEPFSTYEEFNRILSRVKFPCDPHEDAIWLTFKRNYLKLRHEYFKRAELDYAMENGCYGGCFGNSTFTNATVIAPGQTYSPYTLPDGSTITTSGNCDNPTLFAGKVSRVDNYLAVYAANQNANQAQTTAEVTNGAISACQDVCESKADDWIVSLGDCGLSQSTLDALRLDLISFCSAGCSLENPTGLSTSAAPVTVTSGQSFSSFEQIITYYTGSPTGPCNVYLLTDVPPAHTAPSLLEIPMLDECGCGTLFQVEQEYTDLVNNNAVPAGISNIEEYFYSLNGVWFADLDQMLCTCDEYQALGSLEDVVVEEIPVDPILTCENTCTDCIAMNAIVTQIDSYFAGQSIQNDDNYDVILMNWANAELGFSLPASSYVEFMNGCNATSADPYCVISDEALIFKDLLNVIVKRGQLLTNPADPIDLLAENVVFQYSDFNSTFGGNSFWSCEESVCGTNQMTLQFGSQTGSSCSMDLTIPTDYQGEFTFKDITGIIDIVPVSANCNTSNTVKLYVEYYSCGVKQTAYVNATSDCFNFADCSCGENATLCDDPNASYIQEEGPCYASALLQIMELADEAYEAQLLASKAQFVSEYEAKCKLGFNNSKWTYEGDLTSYQFTLYYYDQAGNLVKTVAPQGVNFVSSTDFQTALDVIEDNDLASSTTATPVDPNHSFESVYTYNSYNQLESTTNPDQEGYTNYWYDRYGRVVASQNPDQQDKNQYSYTLYDELGRVIEVGQVNREVAQGQFIPSLSEAVVKEDDLGQAFTTYVESGARTEITRTYYDVPANSTFPAQFESGAQQNLRLRIASVLYFSQLTNPATDIENAENYETAVHYSYDQHGNVLETVQDVPMLAAVGQQHKNTEYEFSLRSGNVKKVNFQKGELDQIVHEYEYDRLNRLRHVYSSKDEIHKSREASYYYHDHGPLARKEIGEYNIQGLDYAEVINGWLKGVNSSNLSSAFDMGKDGQSGYSSQNQNIHSNFAKDIVGFSLGYYQNDYTPINGNSFEANYAGSLLDAGSNSLHNGNLRHIVTAIAGMEIHGAAYSYDQLNRLKGMDVYRPASNFDVTNSWAGDVATNDYKVEVTYDVNGNIQTLNRNGFGSQLNMDRFVYHYYDGTGVGATANALYGTNRLSYVFDNATTSFGFGDLETGMSADNYGYNKIGEMIRDDMESISEIDWRSGDHLIRSITRGVSSVPQLKYIYNPFGDRVAKITRTDEDGDLLPTDQQLITYYAYDANGLVMGVYESKFYSSDQTTTLSEHYLYGGERIGAINSDLLLFEGGVSQQVDANIDTYDHEIGHKSYEYGNHLGNVLVVTSDRKTVASTSGSTTEYEAVVLSAQDYYPFGMLMPNRQYNNTGESYRYAYNGKEKDDELKGTGNHYDFGSRVYDPRIGRFFSMDPQVENYPGQSPYVYAANNPVAFVDVDGEWPCWTCWAKRALKVVSTVLDFVPVVGQIKAVAEAAIGYSMDGTKLSKADRALALAGLIPGGRVLAKAGKMIYKGVKKVVKVVKKSKVYKKVHKVVKKAHVRLKAKVKPKPKPKPQPQKKKVETNVEKKEVSQIRKNNANGKEGERITKERLEKEISEDEMILEQASVKLDNGKHARPDFVVVDKKTGEVTQVVEVKTGNAKLSPNQKTLQEEGGKLTGKNVPKEFQKAEVKKDQLQVERHKLNSEGKVETPTKVETGNEGMIVGPPMGTPGGGHWEGESYEHWKKRYDAWKKEQLEKARNKNKNR